MQTSEHINEIAAACAKAQLELRPALKDAINPAFRSKYADLAAIVEASRIYAKHNVAVFQDVTTNEAGASVQTRLAHGSGQWIEFGPLTIPMAKKDAHGAGSATTYAKRYALSAALGISADEDDDGNGATGHPKVDPANAQRHVKAPDGFDHWLADMEATADEGVAALEKAWKASQPFMRQHLADTNKGKWEAIKARAAKKEKAA